MDARQITYQTQINLIKEFRKHLLVDYLLRMDEIKKDMQKIIRYRLPNDGVAGEVTDQLNLALSSLDNMLVDLTNHITVPDNAYLLSMIDYLEKAKKGQI